MAFMMLRIEKSSFRRRSYRNSVLTYIGSCRRRDSSLTKEDSMKPSRRLLSPDIQHLPNGM
ncbi:hypothetical protein C8J55DRAFT_515494 [Lentinula edodes]|uniref:Uncharacterized protein n=1 Tax=Lentinula lateritia TaxID=40482 RepID=A0A9W9AAR4_9AGAR|nr:hypothetical protein C8J55DRAFT_515494 [Lentinula edodes]